jgi:hypothetical protein
MRKTLKCGLGVLACAALAFCAAAVSRDTSVDRYRAIPERNAFGLKPREQPAVEPAPQKPLRRILLTGITTLSGYKRALLKVEPLSGPGHQGEKEDSMILTEGQREGEIEVVQIDVGAGRVTVNNSGTVMTISFEKDGVKMPGPAPALPPGTPSPAAAGIPPAPLPTASPTPTGRIVPGRPGWPVATTATPVLPPGTATSAPPATATTTTGQTLPPDLTPEERAIVQELQQQAAGSNANESAIPPDTTVPANPGASAPALSPPGLKVPQTVPPAAGNRPIMPQ